MEQVETTGANTILSICSNCRQSFNYSASHHDWDPQIESLLELVANGIVEDD